MESGESASCGKRARSSLACGLTKRSHRRRRSAVVVQEPAALLVAHGLTLAVVAHPKPLAAKVTGSRHGGGRQRIRGPAIVDGGAGNRRRGAAGQMGGGLGGRQRRVGCWSRRRWGRRGGGGHGLARRRLPRVDRARVDDDVGARRGGSGARRRAAEGAEGHERSTQPQRAHPVHAPEGGARVRSGSS